MEKLRSPKLTRTIHLRKLNSLGKMTFIFFFFRSLLVLVLLFHLLRSTEAVMQLPGDMKARAVIVFGDSIVDQGNNNYIKTIAKCNFAPYGKDFQGGVPTGRFSNGKTPSDLIAEEIGVKELVPPSLDPNLSDEELMTGVSFAFGAAGYDPLTSQLSTVPTMTEQSEMFREYLGKLKGLVGDVETENIMNATLFLVVAGSNDLTNTYFLVGRRLHYDVPSYADLLVSSASDFVQRIYNLGARRIAVFGIPPIGCLPSQKTLTGQIYSCSAKYNEAAQVVNSKLSSQMDFLSSSLPGARVVYVDIYNPILDIIQNPQDNGFDVVDRGCCGTGRIEVTLLCNKFTPLCPDDTKYLFWDSFHPTEAGYRILVHNILTKYVNRFF